MLTAPTAGLTDAQRRIVEWSDGPLVVIAGAGTGKTRVIVERVRWLLETKGAEGHPDQLLPEHLLVLTYNVKAAKELQTRIEKAVGVAARSRMTVTNFHSFCQRIPLTRFKAEHPRSELCRAGAGLCAPVAFAGFEARQSLSTSIGRRLESRWS